MMITSFCFSHNGMSMADCYSYSITQDINSIRLQADLYAGNKTIDVVVDETVLENLGNIVSRHHLDQWNGFDKTNSMVLDGEGFSLSITLADENRITASGDNAFPKGYTDVKREICALFDALIDEYGNLYSKILVSDGLDYVMLNFTKRGGKHFFCSAGKKSDGTVKLNHGDIKATQGDTGHSQADMITRVYAHILDEDRKINAQKFESAFYANPDLRDVKPPKEQSATINLNDLIEQLKNSPELAQTLADLIAGNAC